MTAIRNPCLVRRLISAGTSRGRRVIRTRGRCGYIGGYIAEMCYPDLLSRSEKDAPRGNRLIRNKFFAIRSTDKTRELVGTRGNTIPGWFTKRSIGGDVLRTYS